MQRFDRSRLKLLEPLFAQRLLLRSVVDAVLEGRMGRADADDPTGPRVARLSLGCYAVFGGDPAAPGAEPLVRDVPSPLELLCPDSVAWHALLARVHGSRLSDRPMLSFATEGLSVEALEPLAAVPDGFSVRRIDEELAGRLDDALVPHAMQAFDSPQHFAAEGVGFCAIENGTPACAATSYAASRERIELAIATHPAYRRRGLARAVAAKLIVHCLRRGIVPEWSAANPFSQALAEQLGYRRAERIEVSYLDKGAC